MKRGLPQTDLGLGLLFWQGGGCFWVVGPTTQGLLKEFIHPPKNPMDRCSRFLSVGVMKYPEFRGERDFFQFAALGYRPFL